MRRTESTWAGFLRIVAYVFIVLIGLFGLIGLVTGVIDKGMFHGLLELAITICILMAIPAGILVFVEMAADVADMAYYTRQTSKDMAEIKKILAENNKG